MTEAAQQGTIWHRARPGARLLVDGVELRTLAPDSAWTAGLTDPNLASTMVMARFGGVRVLLTGDAEKEIEWRLADAHAVPAVDVLKLGHHGSRTSSTADFLDQAKPTFAVVSAGLDNLYHHPHPDVLARLEQRNVHVLRTDHGGQIRFLTDGRHLDLTVYRGFSQLAERPRLASAR